MFIANEELLTHLFVILLKKLIKPFF